MSILKSLLAVFCGSHAFFRFLAENGCGSGGKNVCVLSKPALVKPRDAVMGGTSFANVLMEEQRQKAADFTREFYATHVAGAFEAFRMTRTRYQPITPHPPHPYNAPYNIRQ